MQQDYLVSLLLHSVTYNVDLRQLLDCPSPQYLEPPKLPQCNYGTLCGDTRNLAHKLIYLLTLFIFRGFYLFHGRFSFANLVQEGVLGSMECDLSLCRSAVA